MPGTFDISDLVQAYRQKEEMEKGADNLVGYPTANPPVAVQPIPGEQGVADPVQKAQERSTDGLAAALGDTIADRKTKLFHQMNMAAGQEIKAVSKAEDPAEIPNADLVPQKPQTAGSPVAPPGTAGPTPAPEAMPLGKMSSVLEEKYNEALKQAEVAKTAGDATAYARHQGKAASWKELLDEETLEGQKEAQAKQVILQALLGNTNGAAVPGAPVEPAKEANAPEAADDEVLKIAQDFISGGNLVGEGAVAIFDPYFGKVAEVLPQHIADQVLAKVAEGLPALIQSALQAAS